MTIIEITRKLIRQNKSRYLLFGLSICFAIAMTGAYGVLLFGRSITDVLMTDGSTYIISLGMYGITMIGIVVFLFYANAIYMQLQMGEIGVVLIQLILFFFLQKKLVVSTSGIVYESR